MLQYSVHKILKLCISCIFPVYVVFTIHNHVPTCNSEGRGKGLGKSRQGLDKEGEEVREKEKGRSKGCRRIEARKEGGGGRRI